jgi:uncharacterized membrane protein
VRCRSLPSLGGCVPRGANVAGERRKFRQGLGYYLLLSLEFLIAADIMGR